MRFVPANVLTEGMVLGKTLYDHSHNVLLNKGHQLTESNIKRIRDLGYQGLYIAVEEITIDNEQVKDVVTDEIRRRAKDIIKDTFVTDQYDRSKVEITEIVYKIVEQLMSNDALVINLYDLKTYDNYTFEHSVNVTVLSVVIGIHYGLSREKLYELGFGAIMHDIGKKFIDIEVLNKKDKLTPHEMDIIREHPDLGAELLKNIFHVNEHIVNCALQHHERFDGAGYPKGLKGREISLNGRIIAICDVFDALTADRVYRKGIPPHEAVVYIIKNSGTHFDDQLVLIFTDHVAPYPIGTSVKLSNGHEGIVVSILPKYCSRPVIKVLKDNNHKIVRQPYDFDMGDPENLHIKIIEVINR